MKLVIRTEKETMTSLELVDKINELRKEENNLKEFQHKDLLKFIRTRHFLIFGLHKSVAT